MNKDYCYSDRNIFSNRYEDYKKICNELLFVNEVSDIKYCEEFKSCPRTVISVHEDSVELDNPPEKRIGNQKSSFMTIGPAFTMALPMVVGCVVSVMAQKSRGSVAGPFMFTGMITAVLSAFIGVFWGTINVRNHEKELKVDEIKRQKLYRNYVRNAEETIREKYLKQASDYRTMSPPVADYIKGGINRYLLWNRAVEDEDFLLVRLGTGSRPFNINIHIPKDKFSVVNDDLKQLPKRLKTKYRMLKEVPVCIDIGACHTIGVVSEDVVYRERIASQIIMALSVSISPEKINVCFSFSEEGKREYELLIKAFKYLPHACQSNCSVHRVILTDNYEVARNSANTKTDDENNTYVVIVKAFDDLNVNVDALVQRDSNFSGLIDFSDAGPRRTEIYFDNNDLSDVEVYSRTLRGLVNDLDGYNEGNMLSGTKTKALPNKISFYELIGKIPDCDAISTLWDKNRAYDSILAPIGIVSNDIGQGINNPHEKTNIKCLVLNLHENSAGPHGLIAGTTGSGKSEILQTIILSLSMNYSPLDVGFFLIDYKGGGMASLFEGLPHVMGQISNLSGKMIQRAMLSIRSENEKRQKLFLSAGVNNISEYQKQYYRDNKLVPLPHIFIIIDEFAELKKEEPEFMGELISVARVGRSLGVHLILATQKPSGTVDDNIWSNSRFKICLRVQDKMDSMEVLHKPDASLLKNPGRAYLQVGNDEIYCQFQGAYTMDRGRSFGANKRTLFIGKHGEVLNERDENDTEYSPQLVDCISIINETFKNTGIKTNNSLWLLPLKKFYGYINDQRLLLGVYDDPRHQDTDYLETDIINKGNHLIQGTFGCGKSTLLMTILRSIIERETPDTCNLYIIDYSGGLLAQFKESLIVGGVICEENEEDLEKLLLMLVRIIEHRKKLMNGQVYRNIQAETLDKSEKLAAIYLAIDGIGALRDRTEGRNDKELLFILKNGPAAGVYTIATANNTSSHELSSRMLETFPVNIPLSLPDKYAYKEALKYNGNTIVMPDDACGRGLFKKDDEPVEFQALYPVEEYVFGYELSEHLKEKILRRNEVLKACTNRKVKTIPSIPKRPLLSEFIKVAIEKVSDDMDCEENKNVGIPVGYEEKTGEIFYIPVDISSPIIVSGRVGSGKKNFKKVFDYVNELRKPADKKQLLIMEDSSNFEVLSEIKKLSSSNPYVIHFGGQTDRVTFADFSYIPYSKQSKVKRAGYATVRRIDEDHFYGDIVIPLYDI